MRRCVALVVASFLLPPTLEAVQSQVLVLYKDLVSFFPTLLGNDRTAPDTTLPVAHRLLSSFSSAICLLWRVVEDRRLGYLLHTRSLFLHRCKIFLLFALCLLD